MPIRVQVKRAPMVNLNVALNVRINQELERIYADHGGPIYVMVEPHLAKDYSLAWADLYLPHELVGAVSEPATTR